MASRFETAVARGLTRMRTRAGQAVTLILPDATQYTVIAVPGKTEFGGHVDPWVGDVPSKDWLVEAADLPGLPEFGWRVVVGAVTYFVDAPPGLPVWRYMDPAHTWIRIHSNAGEMNVLISIESTTTLPDAAGQPIPTWSTFASDVAARIEAASGGETMRGRQIAADVTSVATVRYRGDITPKMRVKIGSRVLGITRVSDPDGRQAVVELHCKEEV